MLHADIQGFERRMLEGARKTFARKAIDYIFVSTHRAKKPEYADINAIHNQCLEFFHEIDFFIIAALLGVPVLALVWLVGRVVDVDPPPRESDHVPQSDGRS